MRKKDGKGIRVRGTDEGGREGGSVGEEDGGRRQHSPFLFLQIKLQTYEKY